MENKKKSAIFIGAIGAVMGYVSYYLSQFMQNSLYQLVFALTVMVPVLWLDAKYIKKEKLKLKITGEILIFLLMWFVVWTIFFNLGLIS